MEKRLGLAMPRSYKDFAVSLDSRSWISSPASNEVGFYAPRDVVSVGDRAAPLVEAALRYPIESSDDEYFKYGVEQDDSSGRSSYHESALVIGRYGPAEFELILMYPQIRTRDGEIESALRYHSGEFRAPTFAEVMRQLSFMETTGQDHVPPYPQDALVGSCADLLPLRNTWWR